MRLWSIPEEFSFDNTGQVVKFPWLRHLFLPAVIILVALLGFGIGRLTGQEREGVSINFDPSALEQVSAPAMAATLPAGAVTASSQGTRYYYSHCGNNISEKNRITFASAAMAEAAGYTLAKNCLPK